jgi:hypothetical protein
MLGIDHFVLGSYTSGSAKALLNVLTLGAWYFFDFCFVISNNGENIVKYGFQYPWIGGGNFGQGTVISPTAAATFVSKFVNVVINFMFAVMIGSFALALWFAIPMFTGIVATICTTLFWIAIGITVLLGAKTVYDLFTTAKATLSTGALFKNMAPGGLGAAVAAAAGVPAATAAANQTGGGTSEPSIIEIAQNILKERGEPAAHRDSIIFISVLACVALSGIAYAVYRYKKESSTKQDEKSGDAAGLRSVDGEGAFDDTPT